MSVLYAHLKSKRADSPLHRNQASKVIIQVENVQIQELCNSNIRLDMGRYEYVPGINTLIMHAFQFTNTCISSYGL